VTDTRVSALSRY